MKRDDIRKAVTAQFYQSLSESGVEITAIPQSQLQAIVNGLADGVFAAFEAASEEDYQHQAQVIPMASPSPSPDSTNYEHETETELWSGRPYLSIGTRYVLTSQRLRIIHGIFGKNISQIELVRIRDTLVNQHIGERTVGIGDITIVSNDPSTPEFILHNVSDPVSIQELIRDATMKEKERRGLHYREEM